ncbi:flagellar biosynthesis protein FlhF [Kordiimonas aestuarii]|uniref:AAA family ATPase n=1 Tax=Kordiimonas aestuarii TaxID=1005925 RepID=UPI0021CEA5C0|nr:AAA family ATPase [Kordiimonas aestuarii]
MRLKTFHAKNMAAVMDQVRSELGPDAIIIQVEEGKAGVRVTAALEAGATPPPPKKAPRPEETPLAFEAAHPFPKARDFDNGDVSAVLNHHGLPFETASHFSEAVRAIEGGTLSEAFSTALEATIRFSPITDATTRPVMLVGPPGAGKTICAAKLTADAVLHERRVHLISTDTVKASGIHQLDHFAQLMKQTVSTADTPKELEAVMRAKTTQGGLTIIDTPGTNPFNMDELKELLKFIQTVDAEPVLVMPAGLDALDAQEIAGVFAKMGCQRFIATRLDAARRYASMIMAARPGYLALAAISRSPYVAEGLETASPMTISRLLTALPGRRKQDDKMDKNT